MPAEAILLLSCILIPSLRVHAPICHIQHIEQIGQRIEQLRKINREAGMHLLLHIIQQQAAQAIVERLGWV